MMISTKAVLCLIATSVCLNGASAYVVRTPPQMSTTTSDRRQVLQTSFAAAAAFVAGAPAAQALEACPKNSKNCVFTTWTPPSGTSKADAAKSLTGVLEAYPQEGQADVDGGGFTIVENDLTGSGNARVEYKSSGKGNFAKFFNGGKPFTDDLTLEMASDGSVQVKSASRVGESDFGVNAKRVDYLAAALKELGWTA